MASFLVELHVYFRASFILLSILNIIIASDYDTDTVPRNLAAYY